MNGQPDVPRGTFAPSLAGVFARACSALVLMLAMGFALADSVAPGLTLSGRVTARSGQPVAQAMVTATNTVSGFGAVAFTRADGRFTLNGLPAGSYRLIVQHVDHLPRDREVVLSRDKRASPLAIVLIPSALAAKPVALDDAMPLNYSIRTLWFGTNRQVAGPSAGTTSMPDFGTLRGPLSLGVCEVSIPRDHRMGEIESPDGVLRFRADPDLHVVLQRTERLNPDDFGRQLRAASTGTPRSALIFVHGFNVSFEDAARRTAQMAYDLQFRGPALFFSWPSAGHLLDYEADGEQAAHAVTPLAEFLKLVLADPGVDQVHLIAHSMGNRVLTGALQELAATLPAQRRPRIGQIALAAPDIDAEAFRTRIAPRIVGLGQRTTMYASTRDEALRLSRLKNRSQRAGDLNDGVTIVDGMDTIDASAVDTSFLGHSYLADNRSVLADVFALLRHNDPPSDRFAMQPRRAPLGPYWVFAR